MALPQKLARSERLVLHLEERGVPGVPVLGRYHHTHAHSALAVHQHPGNLEICFLAKGRQTYEIGGRAYHLSGGDVFLTLPGERHSTAGAPQEKGELYWLELRATAPNLLGLPQESACRLATALTQLPQRHFRGSWPMKEQLDRVLRLYHEPAAPLAEVAMCNALTAYLLDVIAAGGAATSPEPRPVRRSLAPVLRYISQNLGEPLPVPLLAEQAGISVPRFKARFKAEVGMPPGEYVLRAKIAEAERLLSHHDKTVTEITFELGFSSSQYFATVFKRFKGITPSVYRKP